MEYTELRKTTFTVVSEDKAFWVCRGDRITTAKDLANCIESLTPEEFQHHVNKEGKRNDFALWIHDVLKNPALAKDLDLDANYDDQTHYVKTIRDHLAWLETI